jgi:ABC-type multidrug transport system fused ATPase/permease subunit
VNAACFDKVLVRLPLGLNTDIREKGVNLSGGEKQRLALARGIFAAKNSSILLLDEPTSSVDAHNELVIYENIFRKYQDRCVVSSVHRLHLLDLFDMVYVFEHGKVVQRGTFRELRRQEGPFANLWRRYQRETSKEVEERQIEMVRLG